MKAVEDMSREELEEEVAYLRGELGLQKAAVRSAKLADHGLTGLESALLVALYGANGRPLSRLVCEERMQAARHGGGESLHVVNVYISKLRTKLGADVISNTREVGYALTDVGLAKVANMLGGWA